MRLYGIAWDGWKLLNIGSRNSLIDQASNDWWIYDRYAIKDSITNESFIFNKNEIGRSVVENSQSN